jgi:tetratricopeptide (TPR) repeat protein
MKQILALLTLVSIAFLGCSGQEQTVDIPMPQGLDEADPLISKLIMRSANEIVNDPNNANTWAFYASVLLANAYYEESVEASRIAIMLDSDNRFPLRYRQAITLWRLNEQKEALSELQGILKEKPNYDCGWRTLANWYFERGEIDSALQSIAKAYKLAPNRKGTVATYVLILLQSGEANLAIEMLSPRLDMDETPPYYYFLASQAYRRLGEVELMEDAISKGQPLPKLWPDPWLNEIALLATGKRMLAKNALAVLQTTGPKAALPILQKALEAAPNNSQIRGAYAAALFSQKNEAEAIVVLENIPNEEDATADYWFTYANISIEKAKRGEQNIWLPKAMTYFKNAETVAGGSVKLYRSMARLATAMNDQASSIQYYMLGAELLIESGNLQDAKRFLSEGLTQYRESETLTQLYKSLNKNQ